MSKKSGRSYIQYFHDMVESDAWCDLDGDSIKLLMGIACGYKGSSTKPIVCSVRQGRDIVGCGVNKISKLFDELTSHGFLDCHFKSRFNVKNRRASEWYLSWLPHKDYRPSNRWRDWRPEKTRSLNPWTLFQNWPRTWSGHHSAVDRGDLRRPGPQNERWSGPD